MFPFAHQTNTLNLGIYWDIACFTVVEAATTDQANLHTHKLQIRALVTTGEQMEVKKEKVATNLVYSKYVKGQNNTAVSITQPYHYQVTPPHVEAVTPAASYCYASVDDIDERATAFILAVRERIRNEQKMY